MNFYMDTTLAAEYRSAAQHACQPREIWEGPCRMSIYTVIVEEVVSQSFDVETTSPEKALELADTRYNACDYVLESGEAHDARLCVLDESGQAEGRELL